MGNPRFRDNAWVLVLTGVFTIAAVSVFGFALTRRRAARTTETPALPDQATNNVAESSEEEGGSPPKFRVLRVIDGDTLIVIGADALEVTVRLAGVDAPEVDQPHGVESKQALYQQVVDKPISLRDVKKGKYGRYVADVFVDGRCVNRELVRSGHVWCEVNSVQEELVATQRIAIREAVGLWNDPDPISPWGWRETHK